jgi:rhamnose utilization protein RhaD (predicted bifunctional aldolase and dehydrogenase)
LDILQTITELSHEFGTTDYVRGGGGNTSCKNEQTLWVKPSGTTLATLTPQTFVALDRKKLAELFRIQTPADPAARETLVKEKMENAILPETPGRASVEAPLHDSLSARYVVHTHPFVVNGMTCSKNAATICKQLFPAALWLDYIDPGYTLCMQVRQEIQNYAKKNGREPNLIFLKNHGLFVAADSPDEIRALYANVMTKLKAEYQKAGLSLNLEIGPMPDEKKLELDKQTICRAMQNPKLFIAASGAFDVAPGPISPDHIVYSKSFPLFGTPTIESVAEFKAKHGYLPQVVAFDNAVFGVAENKKSAALALELAQDGTLVKKLTQAFGGIDYMTDRAREFIENWEVESYRKKQMEN